MKTKYILILSGLLLLFSACKRDDDEPKSAPVPLEFVYDGNKHILAGGSLLHYPSISTPQAQSLGLLLYTDGVDLQFDPQGFPSGAAGNGFILYFDCLSSDSTVLSSGWYEMDTLNLPKTITWGSVNPVVNGNMDLWFDCKSASFEVLYENGQYTITGEGLDEADFGFTFSYQGPLDWYQE